MSELKSIFLLPYCPLPIDTGAKAEMWKFLNILKELGPCQLVAARHRPVGMGWTPKYEHEIRARGFEIYFREDHNRFNGWQALGYLYGLVCKGLGLSRAFGHSNPYHRYAFPSAWWYSLTKEVDLAVINYSYWAYLPCACPKVVVLHDLISEIAWEGSKRESIDLKSADLVVAISRDEEMLLNHRGIPKTGWSPPLVPRIELQQNSTAGLVGSGNDMNIEGLRWLERGTNTSTMSVRVYGGISNHIRSQVLIPIGHYEDPAQPYKDCGIMLMTTALGTGVQIKGIEALAAGRAIVARRGAMRGIPSGNGAWIEVDTSEEMWKEVRRLQVNDDARCRQMASAKEYYHTHLDSNRIRAELRDMLLKIVRADC